MLDDAKRSASVCFVDTRSGPETARNRRSPLANPFRGGVMEVYMITTVSYLITVFYLLLFLAITILSWFSED
jgi:hypothetical protein